jgi:hypothetical protein
VSLGIAVACSYARRFRSHRFVGPGLHCSGLLAITSPVKQVPQLGWDLALAEFYSVANGRQLFGGRFLSRYSWVGDPVPRRPAPGFAFPSGKDTLSVKTSSSWAEPFSGNGLVLRVCHKQSNHGQYHPEALDSYSHGALLLCVVHCGLVLSFVESKIGEMFVPERNGSQKLPTIAPEPARSLVRSHVDCQCSKSAKSGMCKELHLSKSCTLVAH